MRQLCVSTAAGSQSGHEDVYPVHWFFFADEPAAPSRDTKSARSDLFSVHLHERLFFFFRELTKPLLPTRCISICRSFSVHDGK